MYFVNEERKNPQSPPKPEHKLKTTQKVPVPLLPDLMRQLIAQRLRQEQVSGDKQVTIQVDLWELVDQWKCTAAQSDIKLPLYIKAKSEPIRWKGINLEKQGQRIAIPMRPSAISNKTLYKACPLFVRDLSPKFCSVSNEWNFPRFY